MESEAITATVMDYFEGWFDGDAATGAQLLAPSTAAQMITWTSDGEGKAERPADLAIKVRVDDVHGEIATATVTSAVYIEYVQLVRTAEGWRIVSALYMRREG